MSPALAERTFRQRLTDTEWRSVSTTTTLPNSAMLSSSSRCNIAFRRPFEGGQMVVTLADARPQWLEPTLERLVGLITLPENWDSYGAPPVDPQCVHTAIRLLLDTMQDDSPAPAVVPTCRGGVQLEWHTRGLDLEVEILSPSRLHLYFEDQQTGATNEAEITGNWAPLTQAIASLSR